MTAHKQSDLKEIEKLLAADDVLRDGLLEMQDYDGTLVAFVNPCVSRLRVLHRLKKVWNGSIELHCATDLMVGGKHRD